jgi:hypothetical protein
MKTNYHLAVSIEGALRQRSLLCFEDDNGVAMSTKQAKQFLREHLKLGKKYFTNSDCDNQNADGKCLGHPCEES